jgi:transposase
LKNTIKKAAEKRTLLKAELQGTVETVAEFARRNNITSSMTYYLLKESPTNITKANNNSDMTLIIIEAARMLVVTGVSVQDAAYMAKDFVSVMMSKWIGRTIYFPSKKQLSVYKRVDDIWRQYQAGHKPQEIADRYGVTVAAVSQIIISRCKESGQATPAERRKQNPLTLIHKRILQIADDYRGHLKGQTSTLLQNIAKQVHDVQKLIKEGGQ